MLIYSCDLLGFSQNACPPAHLFSVLPVYILWLSQYSVFMFIAEVTDLTEVYSQSLPVSETWLCFVHCKFFFLFYVFITDSSRMLSFFTHCPRTFLHYPELILCFMHPVYSFLGLFYFLIEYILQKFSKKKGSEKVPVILFILTLSGLTGYRIL